MKRRARNTKTRKSSAPSAFELGANSYGKSRVRMVKVARRGKTHTVHELDVDIRLRGDFEAIHTAGDNAHCLPTDTMKNTVYALGKDHPLGSIEEFAHDLAIQFVTKHKHISLATIRIDEKRWNRAAIKGKPHPHTFIQGSAERQQSHATVWKEGRKLETALCGALADLVVMKTTDSAFSGFPRDEFTTLVETRDRIFCTSVSAFWPYKTGERRFNECRERVRTALIETFAVHKSESVQQTLYAMGAAALRSCPSINEIHLELPNKHCLLVNLAPFGMTNHNEIFVPTDEPHGLIEATISRSS